MIYKNRNIKEIYHGSVKVKELYRGSQLVYQSTPPLNPILYDNGTENTLFGIRSISGRPVVVKETSYLNVESNAEKGIITEGAFKTVDLINLKNYTYLNVEWSVSNMNNNSVLSGMLFSTNGSTSISNYENELGYMVYIGEGTISRQVYQHPLTENIKQQPCYVSFHAFAPASSKGGAVMRIYKIWVE